MKTEKELIFGTYWVLGAGDTYSCFAVSVSPAPSTFRLSFIPEVCCVLPQQTVATGDVIAGCRTSVACLRKLVLP